MNLLLICETSIIEHIFTLICKKLNIDLTIQKTNNVTEEFDFIIIDQSFIDDKFNAIKQFSKKLGAISSEELPFDKSRDFVIPRPFLPTKLESMLLEQIDIIKEENLYEENKNPSNHSSSAYKENEKITTPILNYIDSLDEDNIDGREYYEDEEDESIISLASVSGGILDNSELNKINDILREDNIQNEINLEKKDWKNISDIIDDALDEVREYEFDLNPTPPAKRYNLVLSNFNMNELRPLLEKFDQTVIDKLASGESVDIKLTLKEK